MGFSRINSLLRLHEKSCKPVPGNPVRFADTRMGVPMRPAAQVTEREDTERRILLTFVRYGFPTQPASSVRGSSRRIMTMRFRPADIRVINRRKLPLVLSPALQLPCVATISQGGGNG